MEDCVFEWGICLTFTYTLNHFGKQMNLKIFSNQLAYIFLAEIPSKILFYFHFRVFMIEMLVCFVYNVLDYIILCHMCFCTIFTKLGLEAPCNSIYRKGQSLLKPYLRKKQLYIFCEHKLNIFLSCMCR